MECVLEEEIGVLPDLREQAAFRPRLWCSATAMGLRAKGTSVLGLDGGLE